MIGILSKCSSLFLILSQKYGFTKVRRGPDTDMYAHPSFVRSYPDLLIELRKSSSASRKRPSRVSSEDTDSASSGSGSPVFRTLSPSSPNDYTSYFQPIAQKSRVTSEMVVSSPQCVSQTWLACKAQPMMLSSPQGLYSRNDGTGRLDLLALVIERESCLSA